MLQRTFRSIIATFLLSGLYASTSLAETAPQSPADEVSFASDREFDSASIIYAVAQERGFLAEAGVRITPAKGAPSITPGDASRPARVNSDLVFLGRHRLYRLALEHPGALKVFNINTQDGKKWNEAILARRDLKIDSLEKVPRGAKFALVGNRGASETLVDAVLKGAQIPRDRFIFTNPSDLALRSYEGAKAVPLAGIDLLYAREPYLSVILASGEWAPLMDAPWYAQKVLDPWLLTMSAFDSQFLSSRPGVAKRLFTALERARVFVNEHPEESSAIFSAYLKEKTGVTVKVRDVNYLRYDQVSPEILQKQSDWYFNNGLLGSKIDTRELLFNEHLLDRQ